MADTQICPECETEIGISETVCPSCQLDLETLNEATITQIARAVEIINKRNKKKAEKEEAERKAKEASDAVTAPKTKKKSLLQGLGRK